MKNLVFIENNKAMVDSLTVGSTFNKRHYNVIRDIEGLECSKEFNALNFELVEYRDKKGELRPMYKMTRDGFSILVMGFTGKEAMRWKEKYISAFNNAEKLLLEGTYSVKQSSSILKAMNCFEKSERFQLKMGVTKKEARLKAQEITKKEWGVDIAEEFQIDFNTPQPEIYYSKKQKEWKEKIEQFLSDPKKTTTCIREIKENCLFLSPKEVKSNSVSQVIGRIIREIPDWKMGRNKLRTHWGRQLTFVRIEK